MKLTRRDAGFLVQWLGAAVFAYRGILTKDQFLAIAGLVWDLEEKGQL